MAALCMLGCGPVDGIGLAYALCGDVLDQPSAQAQAGPRHLSRARERREPAQEACTTGWSWTAPVVRGSGPTR